MKFDTNSRAQGTIEYLVIIAIVIVISLVVVALLLNTNNSEEISFSSNKVSNLIGQGGISIVDSVTGEDGKAVLTLQNNSGKNLEILSITPISLSDVEGEEVNCIASFSAGNKENCVLTNVDLVCPCTENEKTTCYYKIKYKTFEDLIKTEKFKLTNVCVNEINEEPEEEINYTLIYNGNNNTSGTVPTQTSHLRGSTVTVSANTGELEREGYTFSGWNTLANGSGKNYTAGSGTFTITSNKTLYAKWVESDIDNTPPTITISDPVEDQEISETDYDFTFNINQDSNQCLVEVNDSEWITVADTGEVDYTAGDYTINTTISDYPGNYYWRVSCSDTNGNWGESGDLNISYIPHVGIWTWSPLTNAGTKIWHSIASSSDGTILVAGVWNNYLNVSTNSGTNWNYYSGTSNRYWISIASSSTGVKLAATAYNNGIYTSTNSGTSWSQKLSESKKWNKIASSSDGTKLVAVAGNEYIHVSSDSGDSWTTKLDDTTRPWVGVASSSDGTKLVAIATDSSIFTSTDSGNNWVEQTGSGSRYWISVTSSSDGTKLAAAVFGGYIYTSSDSGVSWTAQTNSENQNWFNIVSSSDGTKLAAIVHNGYIYTSSDSGVTWTEHTDAGSTNWEDIACSADGTKIVAVDESTIYRGTFE